MASKATFTLPTVTVAEGTTKQQRNAYAASVRQAIADEKRAAITAGMYLTLAKATFTADETEAWKSWATEVTRKSIKTVDSYIAVAKAYSSSTKATQGKVASWTFEALQAFASVPEEDRPAVVAAVVAEDSNPSPEVVRTARDIVRDEKLSPAERAEKDAARRKRERETAASKTEEARKALSTLIGSKGVSSKSPEQLLQIGAVLADGHGQKIAEAAIKAYFVNLKALADKLAERDASKGKDKQDS